MERLERRASSRNPGPPRGAQGTGTPKRWTAPRSWRVARRCARSQVVTHGWPQDTDLDEHRSRLRGATRCISPWHSRASPAPKDRHLASPQIRTSSAGLSEHGFGRTPARRNETELALPAFPPTTPPNSALESPGVGMPETSMFWSSTRMSRHNRRQTNELKESKLDKRIVVEARGLTRVACVHLSLLSPAPCHVHAARVTSRLKAAGGWPAAGTAAQEAPRKGRLAGARSVRGGPRPKAKRARARDRPTSANFGPISADGGPNSEPKLVDSGTNLVDAGHLLSALASLVGFGPKSVEIGANSGSSARIRPVPAQLQPSSTRIRRKLGKFGTTWPDLGKTRPAFREVAPRAFRNVERAS